LSKIDNWPQAPVLAGLPEVARLRQQYDTERLLEDFELLKGGEWAQPRIVSGDGVGSYVTKLDWRSLSLRSIGGDSERTDAGGPGLEEFADTPCLGKVPYIAEVVASIPAPLRSVRLMALGPGAESPFHHDTKYGFPWGTLRLHVPVVTTPGAVLIIGENVHRWEAGALWYADFTRMHMVRNDDDVTRVHMVIDCHVTRDLLDLFPEEFQHPAVRRHALFAAPEMPLDPADEDSMRCVFDMPASFKSFEEADGQFAQDQDAIPARIDLFGEELTLFLDGQPTYRLVHQGDGEFRFAGWTVERSIKVSVSQSGATSVTLRARVGAVTRSLELPGGPVR
jgi:hypothetical protein